MVLMEISNYIYYAMRMIQGAPNNRDFVCVCGLLVSFT